MAALQLREDASTGRLTMVAPLTKRLGGMGFGLLWVVFIAGFFFLPMLASESVDWTNLLFVLVILVLSGGSSLISALTTTTVTIDRGNRTMTNVLSLLAFPLRSTMLSFADLANVELQYYRQSSGRASHDAWRVIAIDKDGRRVPINWDGKQAEMADLAQKMVALTGAPLLDNSIKPESTMQRIFGRGMPPPTTDQPAQGSDYSKVGETQPEADRMPVADQRAAPPPSAPSPAESNEPWAMPMNELAQPPAPADYSVETPPAPATDLGAMSIGELEQRVQSDAMDSETRYALARKYHARGQVDRAIALYQETLRLDTTNPNAQNDLGVALQQRVKRAEAEAAYRRAIALDPFSGTAHLNLGLLLSGMKRATEASQEFLQARQNARGDAETRAAEAASTGAKMEPRLSNS